MINCFFKNIISEFIDTQPYSVPQDKEFIKCIYQSLEVTWQSMILENKRICIIWLPCQMLTAGHLSTHISLPVWCKLQPTPTPINCTLGEAFFF